MKAKIIIRENYSGIFGRNPIKYAMELISLSFSRDVEFYDIVFQFHR